MRRFVQIAIFACLILLAPLAQRAQAQYRFDSWTTDNGLPQASVTGILQTRDGFLWFATFGGLVRYDGLRFQVFNTGNTKGLRTGRFTGLFEDRVGNLWIGTEGQGLTRYKDEVFTTYSTENGLPSNEIGSVTQDPSGNVLFEVGDSRVQWKVGSFTPYTPTPGEPVTGAFHRTRGVFPCAHPSTARAIFLKASHVKACFKFSRNAPVLNFAQHGYPQFHLSAFYEDQLHGDGSQRRADSGQ